MFAVPGWSLPTGPTAQSVDTSSANKPSKKKKKAKSTSGTGANDIVLKPRAVSDEEKQRRKEEELAEHKARSEAGKKRAQLERVKPEKLAELWEEVIEGKKKKVVEKGAEEGQDGEGGKKRKRKRGGKEKAEAGGEDAEENGKKKKVKAAAQADEAATPAAATAQKPKKEKKQKKEKHQDNTSTSTAPAAPTAIASLPALTPLQQKMRAKLSSARFRHINETLYTTPSASSLSLFTTDPSMYHEYHQGFRQQVEVWPENPVDIFISHIRARAGISFSKGHTKKHLPSSTALLPLPRDQTSGVCTIADLGCGDAKIAATFNPAHSKEGRSLKLQVKSFDLQASTPDVTVADIANLPLEKESVDIAIFCLALMGTNFLDFVDEAFRVLRWRGELWVAEIKSRFQRKPDPAAGPSNKIGQHKKKKLEEEADEADAPDSELVEGEISQRKEQQVYKSFVEALEKRGFKLRGTVDAGNKMFVRMEFVKMPEREKRRLQEEEEEAEALATGKKAGAKGQNNKKGKTKFIEDVELQEKDILKPCVYKLR